MNKTKLLCGVLAFSLAGSVVLTSCGKKDSGTGNGIDNETTPLVISSEALDGVFNPFFYTTGPDGDVVGQTQISMLTTDKDGQIVAGQENPCVVENFTYETVGTKEDYDSTGSYDNYYTDYWFAIKNGIKFSDGTPLTIKDVLFNLYVLLDRAYTGSSTLYSVNIKGLKAYRTQTEDEDQQAGFESYYQSIAKDRIAIITEWCDNKDSTMEDLKELDSATTEYSILEYIDKAKQYFKEELNSDWNVAMSSLDDQEYKKYGFTETWQIFLAMEGCITFRTEDDVKNTPEAVEWNGYENLKAEEKQQDKLVERVYQDKVGDELGIETYKKNIKSITSGGWMTASRLLDYITNKAVEEDLGDELRIKNVSGITTENAKTIGNANKKELSENMDILKIRVNGVDPKAIYNFGFTVAPMNYYSTPEEVNAFNPKEGRFGVKFANTDFYERMRKIQVPMGAGPYKATNKDTNATTVPDKSEFFKDNIIYFERNTNFNTVGTGMSNAKIKKLRYKVIATTQLFDAITGKSQEVLYGMPQAKQTSIQLLDGMKGKFDYQLADNLGYGYIGINAGKIPSVEVRRALMYAMDTRKCLDYYGDASLASLLYRPMTSNSWAYPENCKPYYPYDETGEMSKNLAIEAGYSFDQESKKLKNAEGKTLKYTFTIAGDSEDHPAFIMMKNAADILNKQGFDITVQKDANALRKLANGNLEVWAAAWSSTIDPDMFQVYHKDSKASSVKNWGYNEILNDEKADIYYREVEIVEELSMKIDEARTMLNQNTRASIYSDCLDKVMELAVELPTYQRKNMFVWNCKFIDEKTLLVPTAYQSPLGEIWNVSLKEGK